MGATIKRLHSNQLFRILQIAVIASLMVDISHYTVKSNKKDCSHNDLRAVTKYMNSYEYSDFDPNNYRINSVTAEFLCAIYHFASTRQALPTTRDVAELINIPIRQGNALRDQLLSKGLIKCHGVKRLKLEAVYHSPLTVSPAKRYRIDTLIQDDEVPCVQFLYHLYTSMGCRPSVEDMSRVLNLSFQMAHKHAKVLARKGVIKLRKIGFRYDIELLICPPNLKPGYHLISEMEARTLCSIYQLISVEKPYTTVKDLIDAYPQNPSTLSKVLNSLAANEVIKRTRIGHYYAIEPTLPLTPVDSSVVQSVANRSQALTATQSQLISLIEEQIKEQGFADLKKLFEASNTDLKVFIGDLARLEQMNRILTYRTNRLYLCVTVPSTYTKFGLWPTTEFKKELSTKGILITPEQEQVLLFYENHLMKYGSQPPVLKFDNNTAKALINRNIFVNQGRGSVLISKEFTDSLSTLADIKFPYLSDESLEVLRQMKFIVHQRFSTKYSTFQATFDNELIGKRYVCPIILGERLFMTQEDLHKHLKTLRVFKMIKQPGDYYPGWDRSLLYL